MPRIIGSLGKDTIVNTKLITVNTVDCRKEYLRQYLYLKRNPECQRIPPPKLHQIKKEIQKLREMIHPYDAPNFEKTTKQQFHQARKELKKMLCYLS